jgi:hypothetical protein
MSEGHAVPYAPGLWKKREWFGALAGAVFGLLLLGWMLSHQDWASILGHMNAAHPLWLWLAVAMNLLVLLLRAYRWRALIPGKISIREILGLIGISYGINMALPRLGELARVWWLSRRNGLPWSTSLTSVVLDRLLDVIIAGCLFLMLMIHGHHHLSLFLRQRLVPLWSFLDSVGGVPFLLVGALLVTGLGLWLLRQTLSLASLKSWVAQRFLELQELTGRFPRLAFLTVLIWIGQFLCFCCALWAFNLHLGWSALWLTFGFTVFSSLIPTPAGLGSYHVAMVMALHQILGEPEAVALACALVSHVLIVLSTLGFALGTFPLFWREPNHPLSRNQVDQEC